MKKLISLLLILLFGLSARAEEIIEDIDYHRNKTDHSVDRAPMRLPIVVTYDNVTGEVIVSSNSEIDAELFLCTIEGNVIDYSPSINSTLNTGNVNSVTLYIVGNGWYGISQLGI